MRTVRVSLEAWQPPSACACCLQGTANRVALSPRGIGVRRGRPTLALPLCPSCEEHVLFAERGGEARIIVSTFLGFALGGLVGAGTAFVLTPTGLMMPVWAVAATAGMILAMILAAAIRRVASRGRPDDQLPDAHTRARAPVEMAVEGETAVLTVHSEVFARLVDDAHTPRDPSLSPWLR